MDWGLALSTTATGLIVVFLVLVILIIVVSILGKIMSFVTNQKKSNNQKSKESEQQVEEKQENTSVQIELQEGISDEIVAAISAAVTVILSNEGKSCRIRSVKRSKNNRPAWSAAGIHDNTRPF